jgi:nucleotide-binding universal stress UspA family protein
MRILVATDGSESAARAVDMAAKQTKAFKGQLKIVHVVCIDNMPLEQLKDYALREHENLADVLNTFAEEKLVEAKKRAEALGVTSVETSAPFGDVAETLIDAAREQQADMIFVGRRGRGRLSGLLLGSVSQKIVSVAPCPVVVVP